MIEMAQRCGRYKDAREILNDINALIMNKYQIHSAASENDDLRRVTTFQTFFDQISQGLEKLVLVKPAESKPKPPPKAKPEQLPRDPKNANPSKSNTKKKPAPS